MRVCACARECVRAHTIVRVLVVARAAVDVRGACTSGGAAALCVTMYDGSAMAAAGGHSRGTSHRGDDRCVAMRGGIVSGTNCADNTYNNGPSR